MRPPRPSWQGMAGGQAADKRSCEPWLEAAPWRMRESPARVWTGACNCKVKTCALPRGGLRAWGDLLADTPFGRRAAVATGPYLGIVAASPCPYGVEEYGATDEHAALTAAMDGTWDRRLGKMQARLRAIKDHGHSTKHPAELWNTDALSLAPYPAQTLPVALVDSLLLRNL